MSNRILESLVPGLREARRVGNPRDQVATQRMLATRDPLTGLLNERACAAVGRSVLSWALRHDESMSVLVLGLQQRTRKDADLLSVAEMLRSLLVDGDVAARTGAEEFVVLLADADSARAAAIVAQLRAALPVLGILHDGEIDDIAIGVATNAPGGSLDFEALLDLARAAAHPDGLADESARRSHIVADRLLGHAPRRARSLIGGARRARRV